MDYCGYFSELRLRELRVEEASLAMDALSEADRNRALKYRGQALWQMMRGLCDLLVNRFGVSADELRQAIARRLAPRMTHCPGCQRAIQRYSTHCVYCDLAYEAAEPLRQGPPGSPSLIDWLQGGHMDLTDYLLSSRLSDAERHLADMAEDLRHDEYRTRLLSQATTQLSAVAQALCDVVTGKLGVSASELMQSIERHAYRTATTCPGCHHEIAPGVTACIYCGRRRDTGETIGLLDPQPGTTRALPRNRPARTLRDATPEDFPAILRLNQDFGDVLGPLDAGHLARLHAGTARHRVLEQDGEVVAFLLAFREGAACDSPGYGWFAQRYARFLYVDRIVVSARARSSGAGTELYRDVYATAKAERVPFIACEYDSDPPNPATERFHLRLGFREIARQGLGGGKKIASRQLLDVQRDRTLLAEVRGS